MYPNNHESEIIRHGRPRGFTLVELLVVITIIGILIALLLPAVQAAREAARKMQCGNNLKQLALAVLNYESASTRFPAGLTFYPGESCWTVRIMPYLELNTIYDQWSFSEGYDGPAAGSGGTRVNRPFMPMKIPAFCCPSDNAASSTFGVLKYSRSNYVGCFSPSGTWIEPEATMPSDYDTFYKTGSNPSTAETPRRRAVFNVNAFRDISSVKDGLSNTIGISECIGTQADLRGCWWHPWGAQYTHHNTPNTLIPDSTLPGGGGTDHCDSTPDAPCAPGANWTTLDFAARSKHPGGVMAARIDGSVDFYTNNTALGIWQALGSIDGGEVP